MARTNRIEIETYDWLLYQARERLAVRAEQTRDIVAETLDSLAIYARRIEPPARKAVREVFGEIFSTTERTSATREIDWKGVYLWPDNPDLKVALQIVYARTRPAGYSLNHYDWTDWIEHVRTGIGEAPSLLVTESEPADDLQGRLTLEQDGIWYEIEWFQLRPDKEPLLQRLSILVHLPPAISYEEKRSRVAVARGVFERYVALERERALEQKRRDERAILSLSLTPGDMVIHDKFGLGTVISVYGSGAEAEARIDFGEDYGVKHLVLRYSPLKKL